MTTNNRHAACLKVFASLAAATASASWFAVSARADQPAQNASVPTDPDDPKLAAQFSGRVIGPDGQPVPGARVYVGPLSNGLDGQPIPREETTSAPPVRARTDADGRFAFDAPDMTFTDLDGLPTRRKCLVVAAADGYGPDWIDLRGRTRSSRIENAVKANDLKLQLPAEGAPIRGQLLDADARPLAAARVQLTALIIPRLHDLDAHLDRESKASHMKYFLHGPSYERSLYRPSLLPGLTIETRTDAEGRFTLSGLGRDRLATLAVSAPTVVDAYVAVMTRQAPAVGILLDSNKQPTEFIHGADFAFRLERCRTISGVVRDRDTKQPIPGMWVGTGREDYPRDGIWNHQTVTDAEGRFTITGLSAYPHKWGVTAVSPPGMTYQCAGAVSEMEGDAPLVLECQRGVPFRMKVVDEAGRPVEADVTYHDVLPNPHSPKVYCFPSGELLSHTVRQADGTYEGFVLPGPGALFVKTPGMPDYFPAQVDPKAFFAPERTDWNGDDFTGAYRTEAANAYGTKERVATWRGQLDQNDFAAIVLINPAPDSQPLELSAAVVKRPPRRVSLVDPDGQPVVGVSTQGMTAHHPYVHEPPLRAASFPLLQLHPERFRRLTFTKDDRQLIGFLLARGDGAEPYTVRMQPWGTVTGRLLDDQGNPLKAMLSMGDLQMSPDPEAGERQSVESDAQGQFRVDKLIPGQRYSAKVHPNVGQPAGMVFENLVLRPGETRNLGDVRLKPSRVADSGTRRRK